MIPTILHFVKENRGYCDNFGMFEIGHTVEGLRAEDGYCNEQKKLGAVIFSKTETEEALFLKLADVVKELCSSILHKDPTFEECAPALGFEHPANCFAISVDGAKIGYVTVPHPTVTAAIDKKCALAMLEITTAPFAAIDKKATQYKVPSKFPEIEIDLTFNADITSVKFDKIKKTAAMATDLLDEVVVKDIYFSEDGSCALTLRFSFVSTDRTLTKQELAPVTEAVANALVSEGLTIKE
jgi:phenylalanyl-tRNA synthetase beta chain